MHSGPFVSLQSDANGNKIICDLPLLSFSRSPKKRETPWNIKFFNNGIPRHPEGRRLSKPASNYLSSTIRSGRILLRSANEVTSHTGRISRNALLQFLRRIADGSSRARLKDSGERIPRRFFRGFGSFPLCLARNENISQPMFRWLVDLLANDLANPFDVTRLPWID